MEEWKLLSTTADFAKSKNQNSNKQQLISKTKKSERRSNESCLY